MLQWSYYTYWSGLPTERLRDLHPAGPRAGRCCRRTTISRCSSLGWPYAESTAYKADVEANYLKTLELAPEVAARVRGAKREDRFHGGSVPNFFRKPYGPGWGLVGDAGYNKDPITAQGISDAFRDAEAYSTALDECFTGAPHVRGRRWPSTTRLGTNTRCRSTSSRRSSPRMEAPPPDVAAGAARGESGTQRLRTTS